MTIRLSGDTMLLVEWEQTIDPAINRRVIALAERLHARLGRRVRDIVPAYCSVGIHFDPLITDLAALEGVIESESEDDALSVRQESRPVDRDRRALRWRRRARPEGVGRLGELFA